MSTAFKKFAVVALAVATVGFSVPAVGSGQSVAELQAQIAALLAQINALQAQLAAQQGGGAGSSSSSYNYTRDLTLGSRGEDVSALQQMLIDAGYLAISAPTGYFGPMTKSALAKWQAANGISPASGYFGPKTRAYLASLSLPPVSTGSSGSGSGSGQQVPSGSDLSVRLADDNPASATLASGTAFNPALRLVLTAGSRDVRVTSLRVTKGGFVANNKITGVDVVDENGVRYGNVVSSVDADNRVTLSFSSSPLVVPAGSSKKLTVRFNVDSSVSSGTVYFSVASASHVGADGTVSGTFPINGNSFSFVSGSSSVAAVTLDGQPVNPGGANLNVDADNPQEIAKFRVSETSSREGVYLHSLRIYNVGTAADTDYKDVQLVDQSGNVLATAQPSGKYVTFNLSSPYFIDKGLSRDFTVRAKIVDGASRTIQFVVYNDYDLVVKGSTTGASVLPLAGTTGNNDTQFPVADGSDYNKVTIASGNLVFNKASDSPTAAVVPGAQSVELAKFYAKPVGEGMELRKVSFYIQQGGTTPLTGTVYVKVNGSIVYSAAASDISTTTANTYTLSSYPVLASGQNSYITVEASISSNAGSSDSYKVKAFDLTQVKRLVTNDIVDPGVGAVDGNSIAVKAAALAVTTLSQPVSSSVVVGTSQHEFARFELNAQSGGEDVKVKKIVVTDTLGGGASYSNIANLQMYLNGQPLTTTGSTATNGATVTFTFSNPIEVRRDAAVVLSLKADVVGGTAGNTHTYKIAHVSHVEAVGATTGNNVTPTISGNGQPMSIVSSGSLALSLVTGPGASPSVSQLVTIGSTNVPVFAFKLTSQYEAQKVYELKLTWDGTVLNADDVVNLRLYKDNDTTPFATASQGSCSASTCTYTFTWADNWGAGAVQPGSPMTVYVKADIGGQGVARLGDNFKFKIAAATDVKAKGAVSGSNSSVTGTPTVTAVTHIVPFSVVVSGETPSAGSSVTQTVTSGTVIGRFKVQNNGSAQINLTHIKFTDNGTNSSATETYKLWYSDENSSNYTAHIAAGSTSVDFGALGTPITLNGGSYRYLTVTVDDAAGLASGDSFNLAVASLDDLKYNVSDADLGYDGNRDGNSSSGITTGLYVDGKPVLGTIVKQ
jgi:hypothetical protein